MSETTVHRLFVHADVVPWLDGPLGHRLHLVMRHLSVRGTTPIARRGHGATEGWMRTPLDGGREYLWWAFAPATHGSGERAILMRAIRAQRQADEPLATGDVDAYVEYGARGVLARRITNDAQQSFVDDAARVRVLRGHPGTGQTTALFEAVRALPGSPSVLYLTWNAGTFAEAPAFFEWSGVEARVATLTTTLRAYLPDIAEGADINPETSAGTLQAWIDAGEPFSTRTGVARDEVYCELLSTYFGRALPIEVGGVPATGRPHLDPSVFRQLRRGLTANEVLDDVVRIGARLVADGLERVMFPIPIDIRHAVDRLLDETVALPSDLHVDVVVVDDVERYTAVEQFAIVLLAEAIGRARGAVPHVFVSGDDGLAGVPSGFSWETLEAMLNRIERPSRHELLVNVRSPVTVFNLLCRTWELRPRKGGARGPRGYACASDRVAGPIYLVAERTQGDLGPINRLMKKFAVAGRHMVVLPAFDFPSFGGLATTRNQSSWRARGSEMDTVALHNAAPLVRFVEKASEVPLSVRSTGDCIRVALSRTVDRVIFIHYGNEVTLRDSDALRRFCSGIAEVVELGADDMAHVMDLDDLDPEARIVVWCDEADRLLGIDVERALLMSVLATASAATSIAVDAPLRARSFRLRAMASLFKARTLAGQDRLSLLRGAAALAGQAADLPLQKLLANLGAADDTRPVSQVVGMLAAADNFQMLDARIRDVVRVDAEAWANRLLATDLRRVTPAERSTLVLAGDELGRVFPDLHPLPGRLRERITEQLEAMGRYDEALQIHLGRPDGKQGAAACMERLGRYEEAAALWLEVDSPQRALRCWRAAPNPARALDLARRIGDPSAAALALLEALDRTLSAVGTLTPQEARWLEREAKVRGVEMARRKPLT